ncbi:MAG TPA: carbohydrate-binding domain-containing protein, partial [Propionibacteriaceae bacterium]|nr:carbohydrate-binding domain-containing protein [Propionibacteriaceae bacterium]
MKRPTLNSLRTSLAAAAIAVTLGACGAATASTTPTASSSSTTSASSTTTATNASATTTAAAVADLMAANQESHWSAEDAQYSASEAVKVTLSGATATVDGSGATVSGSTLTINAAGTYRLSGTFTGNIVINVPTEDVILVLDDASITSNGTSAIEILAADEVTVVLADGSSNSVTDSATYTDEADGAASAAIDSKADLSFTGSGSLTVTGNHNDAINSSDGLAIAGGTITVKAADDGIRG